MGELPKLPVPCVLWDAKPDLETAATAWIHAGGAHYMVYSQAVTTEFLEDFSKIVGVELVLIDKNTTKRPIKLSTICLKITCKT